MFFSLFLGQSSFVNFVNPNISVSSFFLIVLMFFSLSLISFLIFIIYLLLIALGFSLHFFFCLFVFCCFRAEPSAYVGSQAGGLISPAAAGLHHSHSNTRSKLSLQPTPQLRAMPGP